MQIIINKYIFLIGTLVFACGGALCSHNPTLSDTNYPDSPIQRIEEFDSIKHLLQLNLDDYTQKADTPNMIAVKMKLANLYSKNAFYSASYDEIWEILPLVESEKYAEEKITLNSKLIGLYLTFEQHKKAIELYKTFPELINLVSNEQEKIRYWGRFYSLGAWIELKTTQHLDNAEELSLKSIEQHKKLKNNISALHHTQIQLANIYNKMAKPQQAHMILSELLQQYPLPLKERHALLYERMGEYYELIQNPDSAKYYYTYSLLAIDQFNTLTDKKSEILKKLSNVHYQLGHFKQAYLLHKKASDTYDDLFNKRKSQNKQLFEIKNKYQEQLKAQEEKIRQQKINLLSKENKLLQFRAISIVLIIIVLTGVIITYIRRKNKKVILQQSKINQKQEQELEAQKETLELKNKELLGSALQLLEREHENASVKKQLDKLKLEGENAAIIKQIKNDLSIDKSQKWKEFEKRFSAVNDQFIEILKSKFPNLSPTDVKMCTFIKLGFSSKDMAQIMGITVEGINTSRSRLRKKMDLHRDVILSEFLQGLG